MAMESMDATNLYFKMMDHADDLSVITLHYDIEAELRFFDDDGQEQAASPIGMGCVGQVRAEAGKTYTLLAGGAVSYDLVVTPYQPDPGE